MELQLLISWPEIGRASWTVWVSLMSSQGSLKMEEEGCGGKVGRGVMGRRKARRWNTTGLEVEEGSQAEELCGF